MLTPEEKAEIVKEISVPFDYSLSHIGSANVKSRIYQGLNHWFNIPLDTFKQLHSLDKTVSICELMVDDLEDNSAIRSGHKTAHEVYGVPKTLLSIGFQMCKFWESIGEITNAPVRSKIVKALLLPICGQGVEIYWRDNFVCPTFDEYADMVELKSGSFGFPFMLLLNHFSASKAKPETYWKILTMFGKFYQVDNDLDSLTRTEFMAEKGFCEDISEGKFSYPLIHAIQTRPENKLIFNAMKWRTTDVDMKKRCVALMDELGSFTFTKTKIRELEVELRKEIERLSGNDILSSLLDEYHAKIFN